MSLDHDINNTFGNMPVAGMKHPESHLPTKVLENIKPITPKEVKDYRKSIPDFVINIFNNLILTNFKDSAVITQDEVINYIMAAPEFSGFTRNDIFDKGWLDIESHFRDAGWEVKYDKPGYNEIYAARFYFKPKDYK